MYAEKCVPGVGVIKNLYVNFLLRTEMYGRIVDETFVLILLQRGSTRLFLAEDLEVQKLAEPLEIEGATPHYKSIKHVFLIRNTASTI